MKKLLKKLKKIWKIFSCDIMGWHNGKLKAKIRFDGCSMHARCSKCKREVMMDSQGNWF
jgi:hypothetical protein